jgi:ABC-2 type transport system ATP-binding protein
VSIVEVKELRKQYDPPKGVLAVDGVSFAIAEGEIFSLLGPNGAGKSTTISMLSCLLRPSGGDATVAGHSVVGDAQAVKETIGVVPQDIALYPDMSARENLVFWGKMYGLTGETLKQRVDEVLELITLVDRQKDRVDKFSGGMKRRVNIGVALLHRPKVLYLDEPTVGIDPQSRRSILDGILALRDQGMTILYTTHYMAEAQELSDRIAIVDHGKMIAIGTHEELVKIVGQNARVTARVDHYLEGMAERWREVEAARMGLASARGQETQLENQLAALSSFAKSIYQKETASHREQSQQKEALLDQISHHLRTQLEAIPNGAAQDRSTTLSLSRPNGK